VEKVLDRVAQVVETVPALDSLLDRVSRALPFGEALAACGDNGYACLHDCSNACLQLASEWGYWYSNTFVQCEENVLNGWFGDPTGPAC
jgi:hypothetical protein